MDKINPLIQTRFNIISILYDQKFLTDVYTVLDAYTVNV